MGPHSKSKEGLTCLERRQMVTHAYTLETFAHILHETCLLECVHAQCEIDGKVRIMKILDQMFDLLGMFLANVCCTMDPEVIVLGGGVSKAGQMLVDGATQAFARYAFHACRGTRIVLASLGNDAGAYGAFKLALDAFA